MKFTDIFIKRPVLATVLSLVILLLGLSAINKIQVRQYPEMKNTVITVMTGYPGADAELIAGFITSPIESAVASAQGIDYITSSSSQGTSTVTCKIRLNFDPEVAFTDIMSKVQTVKNQLPPAAQIPIITKTTGDSNAIMYIGYSSEKMDAQQITDYVTRIIKPKLETVSGVSQAQVLGNKTYAMRIFINPFKLAARNLTPADVWSALSQNNVQTAAGTTKGEYVAINIKASTNLTTAEAFSNIVLKQDKGSIIRLKDVAKVELGSVTYDSSVSFNGQKAVFIGINPTPVANPLYVIDGIRSVLPELQANLPPALEQKVVYDATNYIRASIKEVLMTILEATAIVIVVIYLFLGSIRSVMIPVVTIPLSLIGVVFLMLILGYSINLLTLLALVIAIGLVVDDAIVVVENVHRHIEEGLTPLKAALTGAREIAIPVIAMTLTLASVYAPIGFMTGVTGALFKEFAFTLACAVIISGIVALTLSPMMCSKILESNAQKNRFEEKLDSIFLKLKTKYESLLSHVLNHRKVILVFVIAILSSLYFLYSSTAKEMAPEEDMGFFPVAASGPQYATINYTEAYSNKFNDIFKNLKATQDYFLVNGSSGPSGVFGGIILKPWDKRTKSQQELKGPLQTSVDEVAGLQTYVVIPPPLPGTGGGMPVSFVITTTNDFNSLYTVSERMLTEAKKSGLFIFTNNSLQFNKPQATLLIDRNKASELGLTMQDIGMSLSSALAGGYVNYFNLQGRSYEVIPQIDRNYRLTPEQLENIYIPTSSGKVVPLSTISTIEYKTLPNSLAHFQQLNAATIGGVLMPGVTLGTALSFMEEKAKEVLPLGFSYDFSGASRQYMTEGNTLMFAFLLSIIIIFLVLSAQFESFRDPLTILFSVPMSICGALIPLNLGLATINIYTQIGLVTLIGLISKHGILIVDFANHLQIKEGLSIRESIIKSASIRLRPILMTTAAMVFGVLPLLLASGAGAESRYNIGLVITTGMLVGTCFTLFVVPTMYTFFAKKHTDV